MTYFHLHITAYIYNCTYIFIHRNMITYISYFCNVNNNHCCIDFSYTLFFHLLSLSRGEAKSDQERVEKIGEASVAATHRAIMSNDVRYRRIQNIRRWITSEHRELSRKPFIHMPLTTMCLTVRKSPLLSTIVL